MGNIAKIVSVILGSIIGAGFASGQEIKFFFGNYGILGLAGILISTFIIAIIIHLSLKTILKNNVETYNRFLQVIFKKKKILADSMKNIINLLLLASFLIMSIGFSTCLEQQFSIPRYIGRHYNCATLLYNTHRKHKQDNKNKSVHNANLINFNCLCWNKNNNK